LPWDNKITDRKKFFCKGILELEYHLETVHEILNLKKKTPEIVCLLIEVHSTTYEVIMPTHIHTHTHAHTDKNFKSPNKP
jgi:hypothetical protein